MKVPVLAAAAIASILVGAERAQAQYTDGLSIQVDGAVISSPGGEMPRVGGGANPAEMKTVHHGFSQPTGRCVFSVSRAVDPDADFAWAVDVTPIRVVDDAVTFRLSWMRSRYEGKASSQSRGDVELTLRPGESMPLDSVHRTCADQPKVIGSSLRVSVVRYPDPDYDRRLVGLDLWLVEKQRDGTERSLPLSLRGLYNRPIPFYFDSLTEGARTLDIFGEVSVDPRAGTSQVNVLTRSRIFDPGSPPGRPFPRETTATVTISPDEVVSVPLPQVDGSPTTTAFASSALSLRIRVRPLR